MIPEISVDLSQPASTRWHLPEPLQEQAKQLLQVYLHDLGEVDFGDLASMLVEYAENFIDPTHLQEIKSLAEIVNCSLEDALLTTLYYDLLKVILGCTAFAVDTASGPIHARNLDWWTENAILSRYTVVVHFARAASGYSFKSVGWPGFVGVLSGIAPGRFAITLNAASSNDPPAFARPISLFLRTVFETAATYAEAVDLLMAEEIASDCLLLISGTKFGEMAVIERTPTRSAIRHAENGFIAIANEYKALDVHDAAFSGQLLDSSGGRYERAVELLGYRLPRDSAECFAILSDPAVQMNITVQQMVFSALTGRLEVRLPPSTSG